MSSIFGKPAAPQVTVQPTAPPPTPTPTPPPTMPDPFSPATLEAGRKAQAAAINSGGRTSTILTTAASRAAGTIAGGVGSSAKLGTK